MPGNCDQVCMQHLNGQVALGVPLEFSLSVHWSAGHIPTTIKWRPIREVWTSAKPKPARPVKRQLEGLGGLEGIWIDLVARTPGMRWWQAARTPAAIYLELAWPRGTWPAKCPAQTYVLLS